MKNAQWLLVAVLGIGLAGCDDTMQGAKKDAQDNAAAAKGAEPEAKEAARDAKDAANTAVEKAKDGVEAATPAVLAAKQTADVKAALMADPTIDASKIDVDTNGDTKTVTLTGTVPTAAAKTTAETIAKSKAEGYAVVNNLAVGSAAPPAKKTD
jgi:hyperosmotically inducible protein